MLQSRSISNNEEFISALAEAIKYYSSQELITLPLKFSIDILSTLLFDIERNDYIKRKGVSFSYYRQMDELQGGDEFLYSEDGKFIMRLLNYFDEEFFNTL